MTPMRLPRLLSALRCLSLGAIASLALSATAENHWIGGNEHDFGAFDEDTGIVYCEFLMVNETSEPIAILGARANCGCTRPEFSHDPVAPGDTLKVRVGYDPTGHTSVVKVHAGRSCRRTPERLASFEW